MHFGVAFMAGIAESFFKGVGEFLGDNFNKALAVLLLLLGLLALQMQPQGFVVPSNGGTNDTYVHFFYLSTCPHCHGQMEKLNPSLEKEFNLTIAYHEVSAPGNKELFEKVCDERALAGHVPTTLVGNRTFVGYTAEIGEEIRLAVKECAANGCSDPLKGSACGGTAQKTEFILPIVGKIDGSAVSLPFLAVSLGLIDGFNPCAIVGAGLSDFARHDNEGQEADDSDCRLVRACLGRALFPVHVRMAQCIPARWLHAPGVRADRDARARRGNRKSQGILPVRQRRAGMQSGGRAGTREDGG